VSREGDGVLLAKRLVGRGSYPAIQGRVAQAQDGIGVLLLELAVLERDVLDVDEGGRVVPGRIGFGAGEPADDRVERPPVEEGEADEKKTEGEVLCRVQNGGIEEGFGLGQLW
jgi:hypothetical protein